MKTKSILKINQLLKTKSILKINQLLKTKSIIGKLTIIENKTKYWKLMNTRIQNQELLINLIFKNKISY